MLTGAGGRLGRAFCARFASEYHIVAVFRTVPPPVLSHDQFIVDPLMPSTELPENPARIMTVQADLEHPEQLRQVVTRALAEFGRVDLLVNAAAYSVWSPILADSRVSDSAERQFRTNVIVPLRLCEALAEDFWRARSDDNIAHNRNVINISSTAGVFVFEDLGQSVYSASKAALNYLSYHLAAELWDLGVRVNALAPDAFPSNVPTQKVLGAIHALDNSTRTGRVVILDPFGQRDLKIM